MILFSRLSIASSPLLLCDDSAHSFPDSFKIEQVGESFRFEMNHSLRVSWMVDALFPNVSNDFAEKLTLKLKACSVSPNKKTVISCFEATHLDYFDSNGKLLHSAELEQPSYVYTSFVTQLSTGSEVSWLQFTVLIRAGGKRVFEEFKFFDEQEKCITP